MNNQYVRMPSHEYHSMPGLSSTFLKTFARFSPAHAMAKQERDEKFNFGTVAHASILEPEYFASHYSFIEGDGRSAAVKKAKEEALSQGKEILTELQWNSVRSFADTLLGERDDCREFQNLLYQSETELSGFVTHPDLGFEMKIRPDIINHEQGFIADLKTVPLGLSPEYGAMNWAKKQGWFWQAAYYVMVNKLITGQEYKFFWVYAEEKQPHGVRIYELHEASMERMEQLVLPQLSRYAECLATNHWPCYTDVIQVAQVPDYMFSDNSDN